MLRFLLLSALAALVLVENLLPQLRYLEDVLEQIVVGGKVAQPNSWSWQCLQRRSPSPDTWKMELRRESWLVKLPDPTPGSGVLFLTPGQVLPQDNPCNITGWGRTASDHNKWNNDLLYLAVLEHKTCSCDSWWGGKVKTTLVCSGGSLSGCQRNSGGPLNCQLSGKYFVHRVTSFVSTQGCNTQRKPTVFTQMSAYINWINGVRTISTHMFIIYY
ncbi:elastase-1-like [Salmo trutta]|uniref:elastase-1-like n=1 Tax=Salmo trutta TaxID=8032 RepID=UPI0011325049|nr:elastase-1-like [Salmo trutta]